MSRAAFSAMVISILVIATAQAMTPHCERIRNYEAQACMAATDKIKIARCELLNRGICDWRADLAYVYSIDENRGRFSSGKALAKWIEWGDR